MRSKTTNVLQGVVLLIGIVYIVMGLFFYASPYRVFKIFATSPDSKIVSAYESEGAGSSKVEEGAEFSEDDWLKQIINDEIISPLYYIFRIFAVLLMICGIAMVMPLFDPLRYRGLVYYNGLIFPFISSLSLFFFIRSQKSINIEIAADRGKDAATWQEGHMIMTSLAIIFFVICIVTAVSLIVTRKEAKEGRE